MAFSLHSICLKTASASCCLALPKSQLLSPAFQREVCFSPFLISPWRSLLGIKPSETKTKARLKRRAQERDSYLPWKRGSQNDNVLHVYHLSDNSLVWCKRWNQMFKWQEISLIMAGSGLAISSDLGNSILWQVFSIKRARSDHKMRKPKYWIAYEIYLKFAHNTSYTKNYIFCNHLTNNLLSYWK